MKGDIYYDKNKQMETKILQNEEIIKTAINLARRAVTAKDNNSDDIFAKIERNRKSSDEENQFCNFIDSQSYESLLLIYAIYLCGQDICLERMQLPPENYERKQSVLNFLICINAQFYTRDGIIEKFLSVRKKLFVNYVSTVMRVWGINA